MRRIVDSSTRLMSMGYNKLLEEWKQRNAALKDKLRFVVKALSDKDAMNVMTAYNSMKQRANMLNGVGMGDAQMKKLVLVKRLTNQGYNMQVQAINAYLDFLKDEREKARLAEEERLRQQKEKDRILRRVMDVNARLQGQAYRQIRVNMEEELEKERVLAMKRRGICRKIVDANVRLEGMAMNALKDYVKKCLLDEEARRTVDAARDGMMGKMFKTREGHEKRRLADAFALLEKHKRLDDLKRRVIKEMFIKYINNNQSDLQKGYSKLMENTYVRRTFATCSSLYRALEISDGCIDHCYRTHFRLLCSFKQQNPWLKRVVNALTKNVKIDPQIAFWRMKDMRTKGTHLSAGRLVMIKKMFENINKRYQMEVARSFWKIDRCLDLDQTMNSSFFYQNRVQGSSRQEMESPEMNTSSYQNRNSMNSKRMSKR